MKRSILLLICTVLSAERGQYLNSLGADGKFHTRPDMFMCLNLAWNPGEDIREEATLKTELAFEGVNGNTGLKTVRHCVPVTQPMIDSLNKWMDRVIDQAGPVPNDLDGKPTRSPKQ